jgi:hypothetical protein
MSYNPFTVVPGSFTIGICGDGDDGFPTLPVDQDCVSYEQKRSEIGELIIAPTGATVPVTWYTRSEWDAVIDNAAANGVKSVVGMGSFLPTDETTVSLAGGRLEEQREFAQRLILKVPYMAINIVEVGQRLQRNNRSFTFWLYTVGGRVLGGEFGFRPLFTNAKFPFSSGKESREYMEITIDTEFLQFPQIW